MSASASMEFPDAPLKDGAAPPRRAARSRTLLIALFAIQGLSAAVFLGELWSEVLGLRTTPIPFEVHEIIQIAASLGLLAGMLSTAYVLSRSFDRVTLLTRQVDVAAGNFKEHLENVFEDWGLSPSEKAVALYAMKGFSNAEVARFRGTSAATVKSQLKAVYRKSGCANRQQLTAFLVEELLSGVAVE